MKNKSKNLVGTRKIECVCMRESEREIKSARTHADLQAGGERYAKRERGKRQAKREERHARREKESD